MLEAVSGSNHHARSSVLQYAGLTLVVILYSYTQVDLNMTVSSIGPIQTAQRAFQFIGFYRRDISVLLYAAVLSVGFFLYLRTVGLAFRGLIDARTVRSVVILVAAMLTLSYPAFSYDIFNYMFTAKTVLLYRRNPYDVLPRDFWQVDPWVNFMRWIHTPSAYSPVFIALSLPLFLFGFGKLVPVLWNFKVLASASYLLCVISIGVITGRIAPKYSGYAMAVFGLNPLVLIEALVSAHNDIVMMGLALGGMALAMSGRQWVAYALIALSAATKTMTGIILPYWTVPFLKTGSAGQQAMMRFLQPQKTRATLLLLMVFGLLATLFQREFLPWYFLWIMPFVAILPESRTVFTAAVGLSLGLLLRYAPYLYLGHWNHPVPVIQNVLTYGSLAIALVWSVMRRPETRV